MDNNTTTTETTINGRSFKVEIVPSNNPLHRADSIARGWDGNFYMLTGKRGAVLGAYRNAKTGDFVVACNARW